MRGATRVLVFVRRGLFPLLLSNVVGFRHCSIKGCADHPRRRSVVLRGSLQARRPRHQATKQGRHVRKERPVFHRFEAKRRRTMATGVYAYSSYWLRLRRCSRKGLWSGTVRRSSLVLKLRYEFKMVPVMPVPFARAVDTGVVVAVAAGAPEGAQERGGDERTQPALADAKHISTGETDRGKDVLKK